MAKPKTLVLFDAPHRHDPADLRKDILERNDSIDVHVVQNYDEAMDEIDSAEILVTRQDLRDGIPELLDNAQKLEWIQGLSAGYNKFDPDRLDDEGIILTTASGVHANPIAEQVMGYLLVFERQLHTGLYQQQRKEWNHFCGGELRGKTLGIIGVGDIGGRIAELSAAFDMEVLGTKRNTDDVNDSVDEIYAASEYQTVIGKSDYVVVSCPLTDQTYEIIGATELDAMNPEAVLVNIARGDVIDEDALAVRLQKGQLRGAALDVQKTEPLPADSPLWTLSNVLLTPHMAGSTPYYLERSADIFVENYEKYTSGDLNDLVNRVV